MSASALQQHRRFVASAVTLAAEMAIVSEGPNGYAERIWEAFTEGGLELGANLGAFRDWIGKQPGWAKRYAAAVKTYELRKEGLDPNHPEVRRLEKELRAQTVEASRLREKLDTFNDQETVFDRMAATLNEIVAPLKLVPYKAAPRVKGAHPVDMVVALTDQHADEVIHGASTWGLERYNYDIFCLRLERWQKLVLEYATGVHLPQHKVERVHVFHLGDALHGDIHEHKHQNHFGNTMRAAIAVADAQSEAVAGLLEHIPYINLVGVSGNHARTTAKKNMDDPHDNYDFMVLALMQARLSHYVAAGRLDIHAPRSWSAFVDVRGKVMALNHGDDVKGTWNIPWYGFSKKASRVQALVARAQERVDFFWYGHYHTDVAATEAGSRDVHSAAFTLTDPFALNAVSAGGEPMQSAMIVDDHEGMRSRLLDLPIWLRHEWTETQYWEGKLQPRLGRSGALFALGRSDAEAERGAFPLITAR